MKLTKIIGTLLATSLAFGSVGCASSIRSNDSSAALFFIADSITIPEGFIPAILAKGSLCDQIYGQDEKTRIDFSVDHYLEAKKCNSNYFDTHNFFGELSLYTNTCNTFAGELVYKLLEDFEFNPSLRAEQIKKVLEIAEYIEPEMVNLGYERIEDHHLSEMEVPKFETIPALYKPEKKHSSVIRARGWIPDIKIKTRTFVKWGEVTNEKGETRRMITTVGTYVDPYEKLRPKLKAPTSKIIEPLYLQDDDYWYYLEDYSFKKVSVGEAIATGTGVVIINNELHSIRAGPSRLPGMYDKSTYNYGFLIKSWYNYIHPSEETNPDYKDELFEVKLRPQATSEIQGFIARWHILKN
ncbi:MAG: hypothetical protein ABH849_04135 [Nanoarchaeota archaeon]